MHPKLQSSTPFQHSLQVSLVTCAYLLGLLALPITIALCGELILGESQAISYQSGATEIA